MFILDSFHFISSKLVLSVKLLNRNQVIVNYSGSVFLNQNHVIYNVLFIPSFTFNLRSIVKLIANLSCVITFDSNDYHIQDNNSLKMIGLVEMQDMLYIIRISSYQKLQIKPIIFRHIINTINFSASDLETL